MADRRGARIFDSDIGKVFRCGDRRVKLTDRCKSLYLGKDVETGEEFSFYNTGECTSIKCGWIEIEEDSQDRRTE